MITEITKAQLLTWRLGVLKMKEEQQLKFLWPKNNVDMAINIAREARQILGAMGIIGDHYASYDELRVSNHV
jgi:glutaryl-CoA dehydrogenase